MIKVETGSINNICATPQTTSNQSLNSQSLSSSSSSLKIGSDLGGGSTINIQSDTTSPSASTSSVGPSLQVINNNLSNNCSHSLEAPIAGPSKSFVTTTNSTNSTSTPPTNTISKLTYGIVVGNRIEMKLIEPVVQSFEMAKVFRENTDRINSIDFSANGETLISSSDDDSIVIYDCEKGTMKRTLNSKKYGVDLIHYTHAANTAIHSSNKVDDTIRYLSLHDNKYIRYFPGHTKKVVTLCMSPVDDTFLSGSLDKTIRLWDLRSPNCQGLMHLLGRPVANFDPDGLIFAVGIGSESIKLYDLRSFDKGPFQTFKLPQDKDFGWTGIKLSPDGKMIMIYTNGNVIHLIDAFTGQPLQTLMGHTNNKGLPLEASFSPDSQFFFSGSKDGRIHVWNAHTGIKVTVLQASEHQGPVQSVQFNPKYMMLASACSSMAFWVPSAEIAP